MKLLTHITIRISVLLMFVMTLWAYLFYLAVINEVNDEVDDSLDIYAERIESRFLAGDSIPHKDNGTNNSYSIKELDSSRWGDVDLESRYLDSMIYLVEKQETEPARILKSYFRDRDSRLWEVTVAVPTIEKGDLQEAILQWLLSLYLLLLVVLIVSNVLLFKYNMRPLYILLRWLDNYKLGGKNEDLINDSEILEFKRLNEAVIRNARRSEELFTNQKSFIGNASHEIQTPIAVCTNRLEMILQDDSLSESQAEEIAKVIHSLQGVARMNRSLLLLSKIDNHQYQELVEVNINNLVHTLSEDFSEAYSYLKIKATVTNTSEIRYRMSSALASILIANLLKNAYLHNNAGGIINIEIKGDVLSISNSGEFVRLDEGLIFERFYHKYKKSSSSGLGLAIVDSICKYSDIGIQYNFLDGMHVFILKFKI
ncbi:MAG: histidine kinase dimerization/phospho-acceptor domain-containing protein [Bacteroidales bacterium]